MAEPLDPHRVPQDRIDLVQEKVFADRPSRLRPDDEPAADRRGVRRGRAVRVRRRRARSILAGLLAEADAANAVPVVSHERLSGDIETGGVDSQPIADRLAETFRNAKVLIVIREQRDMLLSIHKTELTFGTYRDLEALAGPFGHRAALARYPRSRTSSTTA